MLNIIPKNLLKDFAVLHVLIIDTVVVEDYFTTTEPIIMIFGLYVFPFNSINLLELSKF